MKKLTPQMWCCQTTAFILQQFWTLQIRNQAVGEVVHLSKTLEENTLPLPASGSSRYSLACGCMTPIPASVFT